MDTFSKKTKKKLKMMKFFIFFHAIFINGQILPKYFEHDDFSNFYDISRLKNLIETFEEGLPPERRYQNIR